MGARILCTTLIIALTSSGVFGGAHAADRPVIETVIDHDSGVVLWSSANPIATAALKPGQEIPLKGHNFGPGPITAARPGLGPPAGGVPPGDGTSSVATSPPEAADKELSKVLFGNVRAFEHHALALPICLSRSTMSSAVAGS